MAASLKKRRKRYHRHVAAHSPIALRGRSFFAKLDGPRLIPTSPPRPADYCRRQRALKILTADVANRGEVQGEPLEPGQWLRVMQAPVTDSSFPSVKGLFPSAKNSPQFRFGTGGNEGNEEFDAPILRARTEKAGRTPARQEQDRSAYFRAAAIGAAGIAMSKATVFSESTGRDRLTTGVRKCMSSRTVHRAGRKVLRSTKNRNLPPNS
jgi:hypothetical protein